MRLLRALVQADCFCSISFYRFISTGIAAWQADLSVLLFVLSSLISSLRVIIFTYLIDEAIFGVLQILTVKLRNNLLHAFTDFNKEIV